MALEVDFFFSLSELWLNKFAKIVKIMGKMWMVHWITERQVLVYVLQSCRDELASALGSIPYSFPLRTLHMALPFIQLCAHRGCCSVFDGGACLQKGPNVAFPVSWTTSCQQSLNSAQPLGNRLLVLMTFICLRPLMLYKIYYYVWFSLTITWMFHL